MIRLFSIILMMFWLLPSALLAGDPVLGGTGEALAMGSVSDPSGFPASNVEILLEISDMRIRRQVAFERVRSDIGGRFRIDLSKYADIPRLGLQFETQSPRYRLERQIVEADQAELPVSVDFVLEPGTVVAGVVRNPAGEPIEDVEIRGFNLKTRKSNERGEFEIFGLNPVGTSRLSAFKEGYSPVEFTVESSEAGLIEGIQLSMSSAADITGEVRDPNGAPIVGARIYMRIGDRFLNARTDQEGGFALDYLPMQLDGVVVTMIAEGFPKIERLLNRGEIESRRVLLEAEWPVALEGIVSNSDGNPATGVEVFIQSSGSTQPVTVPVDETGRWRATPFDPASNLLVMAVPSSVEARTGLGELEFLSEGTPGTWRAEVNPWPEGFRSSYEVTLAEDRTLKMVRNDVGPRALPGNVVYSGTVSEDFSEMNGTILVESTGAAGTFRATAYNPGRSLRGVWDLRETIGEGTSAQAPAGLWVKTPPFPGTQMLDLTLTDSLSLSGKVLDRDGNPVPSGFVRVMSWNGAQFFDNQGPITAGGGFELKGLPEGPVEVAYFDADGIPASEPVYLRGGLSGVEIRLGAEGVDGVDEVGK